MRSKCMMRKIKIWALTVAMIVGSNVFGMIRINGEANSKGAGELADIIIEKVEGERNGSIVPSIYEDAYAARLTQKRRSKRSTLPAKYDLRAYEQVTPVKNQNPWGSCWTFGAISGLESNMLIQNKTKPVLDYSELQIAWNFFEKQTAESLSANKANAGQVGEGSSTKATGNTRLDTGGNTPFMISLLAAWQGAANESDIPYQATDGTLKKASSWAIPKEKRNLSAVQLKNAFFLPNPTLIIANGKDSYDASATEAMKTAIQKNGALNIAYHADQSMPDGAVNGTYFNYTNWAQYVSESNASTAPNHSVSIVGWDDSFSKDKFNTAHKPENDGAWLVKNSWGTSWGLNGYFWLSYYDKSITQITSIQSQPVNTYDKNYQYDFIGHASRGKFSLGDKTKKSSVANVFTIESPEQLEAVSATTIAPSTTVRTQIYKLNDKTDYPKLEEEGRLADQSDILPYAGYHSVPLKQAIPFKKGDTFAVIQTLSSVKNGKVEYQQPIEVGDTGERSPIDMQQTTVLNRSESYLFREGMSTMDLYDIAKVFNTNKSLKIGNAMIKAFTKKIVEETIALTSFTYQAYDGSDQAIKTPITYTNVDTKAIALPQGTASIKITAVNQTSVANTQISVNGSAYTLGQKIDRASFTKTGDEYPIKFIVAKANKPKVAYGFAFTTTPFVLTQGNITIKDRNYHLSQGTQLSVTNVASGDDFNAVKAVVASLSGGEKMVLQNLTLNPDLKANEVVNVNITLGSEFNNVEKTMLHSVKINDGVATLTEIKNMSKDANVISGDVSTMGYYVLSEIKEVPTLPVLSSITYKPKQTLASALFPSMNGGTWHWDDPTIVPSVDRTSYPATFTPSANSNLRSYKANIPLLTKKASVTIATKATPIVYGQTLIDSVLTGTAMLDDTTVLGTFAWEKQTIFPSVKDSEITGYKVVFTPTDKVNYHSVNKEQRVTVTKKAITITAKDATKVYGDENPLFAFSVPQGDLVGTDTAGVIHASLTSNADETTSVGTSVITGSATANNYSVTIQPGRLTITKRPLSVMIDAMSLPYGSAYPKDFTYKIANLVNEDKEDPKVEIELVSTTKDLIVGSYELRVKSFEIISTNYMATRKQPSSTLTVTPNISTNVTNTSVLKNEIANLLGVSGSLPSNAEIKIGNITDEKAVHKFKTFESTNMKIESLFDLQVPAYNKTKGKLVVRIPVDTIYNGQKVTVLHYVDTGKIIASNEIATNATVDSYTDLVVKNGMVEVEVFDLSPFALLVPTTKATAETPAPATKNAVPSQPTITNNTVRKGSSKAPNTGDSTSGMLFLSLLLLSACIAIALVIRKKLQYKIK